MAEYEDLTIDQGADVAIELHLKEADGSVKDLSAHSITSKMKRNYNTSKTPTRSNTSNRARSSTKPSSSYRSNTSRSGSYGSGSRGGSVSRGGSGRRGGL